MTICIAYKDRVNNKVICASDSLCRMSEFCHRVSGEKIFMKDNIGYLYAGNVNRRLKFRYKFNIDFYGSSDDVFKWLNTDFMDVFKKFRKENEEYSEDYVDQIIIIIAGRIFSLHTDFSIAESNKDYICIGCGQEIAYGALYALENDNTKSIREKIEIAINACNEFSCGCDNIIQWMEI